MKSDIAKGSHPVNLELNKVGVVSLTKFSNFLNILI